MIRINLVRSRVGEAGPAGGGNLAPSITTSSDEKRETFIKVAFIALFTLGLMMWESQNIRTLNEERNRLTATVTDLEAQAQAKAAEVNGIKDIARQAQELEDKLKVLKLLSKLRLREVKTLDFMQSSIPEKVWLKAVKYEYNPDNVEQGRYEFTGNAVTTEDLSEFVKRLEDSAYLTEVIVIRNQESQGPGKSGGVRDFNFTADVEVKN